ncbi:ABC transporter substrate-binding protein [Cohnella lupini]|uniref:Carbohydrate ABC transporter substrate-binding protein (CUT1 family) n=1 Tax=Cohnella lupini TaxID=1294267 RepID=A0A3D9ITP0_9BACL|nr:sugar ABC transporter substrate-binding protein [Cohnella lupini]RED65017.1 carbohydrate ABC transporter substrate-binding protein (CUT1 family) [Cohnella lupini]
MVKLRFVKALTIIVIIAMVSVIAACSGGNDKNAAESSGTPSASDSPKASESPKETSEAPEENVTVKFGNFSGAGDTAKYLTQMQEAFEKEHPNIKIEIETIAYGDYFTQMQTRVAAGQAPDAYELNYENFVSYAKKGVLLDINPFFEATQFDKSTLNQQALNAFSADGTQYGMPGSFSNVLLIYNKELFAEANAELPTNDWTWKEFDDAAAKIRALDKNTFGVFQPIQFHEFYKLVQQNDGSLLNADKTAFTVNSPENVETLQRLVDRVLKSNVMPTQAQLSGVGDWDLFKAGRLGMIVTGVWAFSDFMQNVKFEWDVAVEPGNKKKATHFFSNGLVINKDSKVAEAAFEWIKFLSSSKEAAKIRVDAGWELPAVTYPDVLEAYLKTTPPANRQAVFDSLEFLVTPPVIEQFTEMADILGIHLTAASEGAKSAQEALDDAQKELTDKIKLQ